MFIVFPIVGAVVIVFFGYFALWSASQANTPAGISSFGKVLAIILFVIAGLVLIGGIARHGRGHMMGRMGGWDGNPAMMQGCPGEHKPWMMKPGEEKDKKGAPSENNGQEPAQK